MNFGSSIHNSKLRCGSNSRIMDSISRISALIEPARDLTLEASAVTSGLRRPTPNPSNSNHSLAQTKKLLESRHEREVLDGLKRLITVSQHPRTRNDNGAAQLLPTVLKNISSPNTHVRKLVYAILVAHAESDQDTALLSINSIQKSLSASDPHLRALALRTISSLRVPVIAQIVALGIKRGVSDISAIVHRTAALAIPKCWKLDPTTAPQLEGYLEQLLGDRQFVVAGAACIALCETGALKDSGGRKRTMAMLHRHYRGLCKKLVDMDEWGQLAALRILAVYARQCFPRRTRRVKKATKPDEPDPEQNLEAFYDEPKNNVADNEDEYESVYVEDYDLAHLFNSAQPLLHSRNPAVVVATSRLFISLSPPLTSNIAEPPSHILAAISALLALLRPSSTPSTTPVALHSILQLALLYPRSFVPWTRHFLLHANDAKDAGPLKLELLVLIFPHAPPHTQSLILAELANAARRRTYSSVALLRTAIGGIGRCAASSPLGSATSNRCLSLLLEHVKTHTSADSEGLADAAADESLTQIRHLIQGDPTAHISTVIRLAKDLDTTVQPRARAAIIWLVGQYSGMDMSSAVAGSNVGNIAADVLRILCRSFADEAEIVKTQILLLAAKCYLHYLNAKQSAEKATIEIDATENSENQVPLLYAHVHALVRYDTSYILRDVARLHRSLLPPPQLSTFPQFGSSVTGSANTANTQLATLLLLAPKPPPVTPSPAALRKDLELGSAALVLGDRSVPGYEEGELPEWVKDGEEPDPRLRDEGGVEIRGLGAMGIGGIAPAAEKTRGASADTNKATAKERTLEDWLDDGNEEEESSEEESTEEESSNEETASEEESEEEEETDDEGNERERLVK